MIITATSSNNQSELFMENQDFSYILTTFLYVLFVCSLKTTIALAYFWGNYKMVVHYFSLLTQICYASKEFQSFFRYSLDKWELEKYSKNSSCKVNPLTYSFICNFILICVQLWIEKKSNRVSVIFHGFCHILVVFAGIF